MEAGSKVVASDARVKAVQLKTDPAKQMPLLGHHSRRLSSAGILFPYRLRCGVRQAIPQKAAVIRADRGSLVSVLQASRLSARARVTKSVSASVTVVAGGTSAVVLQRSDDICIQTCTMVPSIS